MVFCDIMAPEIIAIDIFKVMVSLFAKVYVPMDFWWYSLKFNDWLRNSLKGSITEKLYPKNKNQNVKSIPVGNIAIHVLFCVCHSQ